MLEDWQLLAAFAPEYGVKILVAVGCGLLLGIERERKDKPAGLRTIILITVGATLYMIVSDMITLTTEGPEAITRVDPSRIAAQVVTGIGFLGAGTIIQARGSVHGLTTAATIWVSAGIGLCIGAGFPILAVATTLIVLLVLVALGPFRTWLSQRGPKDSLYLKVRDDSLTRQRVKLVLENNDVPTDTMQEERIDQDHVQFHVFYQLGHTSALRMLEALNNIEGVRGVPHSDASS